MTKDFTPVNELKNIGPKSSKWLLEVGIKTKQDIIDFGPANVYQLLKSQGMNVSMVMAYALQGAIMDIHWNEIPDSIKNQVKRDCKI